MSAFLCGACLMVAIERASERPVFALLAFGACVLNGFAWWAGL